MIQRGCANDAKIMPRFMPSWCSADALPNSRSKDAQPMPQSCQDHANVARFANFERIANLFHIRRMFLCFVQSLLDLQDWQTPQIRKTTGCCAELGLLPRLGLLCCPRLGPEFVAPHGLPRIIGDLISKSIDFSLVWSVNISLIWSVNQ